MSLSESAKAIEMASFDQCSKALEYIRTKTSTSPKIGIVCGSGLGGIGDLVVDPIQFPYKEIPGFHESSVTGHKSRLLVGKLAGVDVVLMQGRFHGYEGIPYSQCAFPIRVMKLMGIEKLIVTNAAGGLNKNFKLGDFMVLEDHLRKNSKTSKKLLENLLFLSLFLNFWYLLQCGLEIIH